MKNDFINSIYIDVSQTDEYLESEEMKRLEETQSKQGKAIREAVGDRMYIDSIDGLVAASEADSERYGFIMGFKYAMRLMQECLNPAQQNT